MARSRRRTRAGRRVVSARSADELAVQAAEAIVGRAWAEQLLRYYNRMDNAFHAAREQGRQALQAALEALVRMDEARVDSAQAANSKDDDPAPTATSAVTSRPLIRLALPAGRTPEVVRRALWRFGRLRTRRASPDAGQQ